MESKLKAKEILDYCYFLLIGSGKKFRKTRKYKEMLKEITFMIDND